MTQEELPIVNVAVTNDEVEVTQADLDAILALNAPEFTQDHVNTYIRACKQSWLKHVSKGDVRKPAAKAKSTSTRGTTKLKPGIASLSGIALPSLPGKE